jgi:uncharacterized membrane protein YkvA (DUF1232 family)
MIATREMIAGKEISAKIDSLKGIVTDFKREFHVYRRILKDQRTPKISRVLLGCAALYAVMPFDLIPDVLPLVGQVDDAFVISTFVTLGLAFLPEGLVIEHRREWTREQEAKARERRERYNRPL